MVSLWCEVVAVAGVSVVASPRCVSGDWRSLSLGEGALGKPCVWRLRAAPLAQKRTPQWTRTQHTLSLSHSLTLSLSHSLTLSLSHSLTLSLSHSLTLSLCHSLTLSFTLSLTRARQHSAQHKRARHETLHMCGRRRQLPCALFSRQVGVFAPCRFKSRGEALRLTYTGPLHVHYVY